MKTRFKTCIDSIHCAYFCDFFNHGLLPRSIFLFTNVDVLVAMRDANWHLRACIVQCVEPQAELSSCTGPLFASRSLWLICVSSHGVRLCLDCKGEERCSWKKMALAVCVCARSFPKIWWLSERGECSRHNTQIKADASLQAAHVQEFPDHVLYIWQTVHIICLW